MNYKDTLNLPQTGFPMKAGLVEREPQRLEQWYAEDLHARIRERHAQSKETFVLHDGPPFANGDVHIGTALNKILKDAILKFQTMRGKNVPYVPGWDCHGLPIEFKVVQELRKTGREDATPAEIRRECEAYARKYIDHQRTQFKRLACLATGKIRTSRSTKNMRPMSYGYLRISLKKVLSIVAKSPCTGASLAVRRWPKPKWSTQITSANRFL